MKPCICVITSSTVNCGGITPFDSRSLEAFEHLRELLRKLVEPRDVGIRIVPVVDLMRLRHEVRQRRLDARELVDRKIVVAEFVALDLDRQEVVEHVVRKRAVRIELRTVVAMQRLDVTADHVGHRRLVRRRGVVELVAVEIEPRRQDAHVAEHLGTLQRELAEHAPVEPVDAGGLEVPDVDEESAREEDRERYEGEQPLEEALHGRAQVEVGEA